MKKLLIILTICILVLAFGACGSDSYKCEVIRNNFEVLSEDSVSEKKSTVSIGNISYDVQYDSSTISELNNETYDIYKVVDENNNMTEKMIEINSRTNEIVCFSGITPYSKIENIELLSDYELKVAVEQTIGDTVDFSVYNTFTVERYDSELNTYHLVWQLKREMLCNVKLDLYITAEGFIEKYSKTDACPNSLTRSFVSNSERDTLLENSICEYLNISSIYEIEYEIQSETLSYYKGKSGIIYAVKIISDGFVQLIVLAIS